MNDTAPVTRPVALTGVTADHPPATGGATTVTVAAAPGTERSNGAAPPSTGAAATNAAAPLPIARDPNNPASRSRSTPNANTPNPANGPAGAVGLFTFKPNADNTVASNRAGRIAGAAATFGIEAATGATNTDGTPTAEAEPTGAAAAGATPPEDTTPSRPPTAGTLVALGNPRTPDALVAMTGAATCGTTGRTTAGAATAAGTGEVFEFEGPAFGDTPADGAGPATEAAARTGGNTGRSAGTLTPESPLGAPVDTGPVDRGPRRVGFGAVPVAELPAEFSEGAAEAPPRLPDSVDVPEPSSATATTGTLASAALKPRVTAPVFSQAYGVRGVPRFEIRRAEGRFAEESIGYLPSEVRESSPSVRNVTDTIW